VRRLGVLASLYLAQGLPFGFFSHAVPVLLNRSHPPQIVGLSSLLAIPWALKFLIGPYVDRVGGGGPRGRRRVILPLQALTVSALVVLGLTRPSEDHLTPLLVGFFIVSLFSAAQDVATDALAIDLLDEKERGRGGAVQAGAYRAGMIAGGGGILAAIAYLGFREAFFLMALIVALASVPALVSRETRLAPPARATDAPASTVRGRALLSTFFRRADAWRIVAMLVCFKLGDALCAGMVTRWFVKQGLSTADVATTRGLAGGAAAIAGALLGGYLYRALGRKPSLIVCAALQAGAIAMYVTLDAAHPILIQPQPMPIWIYYGASVVEHVFGGAATAVLFARMMDLCRDEARATDFTVQSCILVAVTGLGLLASGFVVKATTLSGLFVVATLAGIVAPVGVKLFWVEPRRIDPVV